MNNVAFGRKVRVTIYPANTNGQQTNGYVFESDLMNGKRGLKISGTITKYFAIQPPQATIDIYNLSPVESANILALRMKKVGNDYVEVPLMIKIEAGYSKGYFGEIFKGQILKPNMVKPDANNTILRLTCLNAAGFIATGSLLTQTFNDGINYYTVAKQVLSNSNLGQDKLNAYISDTLKNYKVDGSFVTSTTPYLTLKELCDSIGDVTFTITDDGLYLQSIDELLNKQQDAIVLNYETGLIGFPSLSTDGMTVQSVLNPNIKPLSIIKLDNSVVSINQPDFLENRKMGAWLSSDGLYRVIEVSHQFDTTTGSFVSNCKCLARNYYNILNLTS